MLYRGIFNLFIGESPVAAKKISGENDGSVARAQRLSWSEATNVARPARSASSIGGSLTRSNEGVRRDLMGYEGIRYVENLREAQRFEDRTRFAKSDRILEYEGIQHFEKRV